MDEKRHIILGVHTDGHTFEHLEPVISAAHRLESRPNWPTMMERRGKRLGRVSNMNGAADRLEQAMHLAEVARHMLLATVDETGAPRLTPVEECTRAGANRVVVRAWIDVPPLEERGGKSRLALLLWDENGHGYQLTGQVVRMQEAAVLDGLAEIERQVHFPQIERDILMQVDSVEDFRFTVTEHPPLRR